MPSLPLTINKFNEQVLRGPLYEGKTCFVLEFIYCLLNGWFK